MSIRSAELAIRLVSAAVAALLPGCTSTDKEKAVYYAPAPPQGEAPAPHKIAEDVPRMFAQGAHPTDVLATAPRPAVEQGLFSWLVCVRARVNGVDGNEVGIQTIAVFYQKNEIVLRRREEPHDKCRGFEKVTP
jgi:hypothetical protein